MSVVKPTLRIFDYDKTIEFYVDWLGFTIDWVHEFIPGASPKFMQVSFRDILLYLSEHHGDASPGSQVNIEDFEGLRAYNKELNDKNYKYGRPGLEVPDRNKKSIYMTVHDPFGNKLTFSETVG
jgi:catechol 2,3-dioxygenase-like lactoylglutathione lyase family enzyme